ncbi:SH3 domain-containing protein [Hyphomicrobiales bacterium]|jgi:SH3-like domain-containing protein|nr:SH3 domain-containing protein [Rhodobiaceae bacterium]MBT5640483.1 SH3 domain-containing protein [Rhodobiaceae bacterium]MBT6223614.1 SH3 domain-containing protein [Rhodobiaceae bacterium]MDC0139550.1 SH3 domain-containing protein [Hyphomicrobiales bacterium]
MRVLLHYKTYLVSFLVFIFLFAVAIIIFPDALKKLNENKSIQSTNTKINLENTSIVFKSLKKNKANLRQGPSLDHQVLWTYNKYKLPVEIIGQTKIGWSKIRDFTGGEGWVSNTLLSNNRTAMIAPWDVKNQPQDYRNLFKEPLTTSRVIKYLEPGVVVSISQCTGSWCNIYIGKSEGWIKQNQLYGVYIDEVINIKED